MQGKGERKLEGIVEEFMKTSLKDKSHSAH